MLSFQGLTEESAESTDKWALTSNHLIHLPVFFRSTEHCTEVNYLKPYKWLQVKFLHISFDYKIQIFKNQKGRLKKIPLSLTQSDRWQSLIGIWGLVRRIALFVIGGDGNSFCRGVLHYLTNCMNYTCFKTYSGVWLSH